MSTERRGEPGTIPQRKVQVYLPTLAIARRYKAEAKRRGLKVSRFIYQMAEKGWHSELEPESRDRAVEELRQLQALMDSIKGRLARLEIQDF